MKLVCLECDPQTVETTSGEKITLADAFEIVTETPESFHMPRQLREVASIENGIATLQCGHSRKVGWLRFSGEQVEEHCEKK